MAFDWGPVITFATGSLVGVIVTLVVGYFLIKFVLAKLVAVFAKFGISALGWLLPKGVVNFLKQVVKVAEATQGPKILKFKK